MITITQPNAKGQVVIPKKMRTKLNINSNTHLQISIQGNSITITPVKVVADYKEKNETFLEILKRTQGAWADEDFSWINKKRKIELLASSERKNAW